MPGDTLHINKKGKLSDLRCHRNRIRNQRRLGCQGILRSWPENTGYREGKKCGSFEGLSDRHIESLGLSPS